MLERDEIEEISADPKHPFWSQWMAQNVTAKFKKNRWSEEQRLSDNIPVAHELLLMPESKRAMSDRLYDEGSSRVGQCPTCLTGDQWNIATESLPTPPNGDRIERRMVVCTHCDLIPRFPKYDDTED